MTDIPARLREAVQKRARDRCEYCQLSQVAQEATFHVDHITPRAQGGPTIVENLALACVSCSLRKGSHTTAVDLSTGNAVRLFNPRLESWSDHFAWLGIEIIAKSPIGRAMIMLLDLNRPSIQAIRSEEMERGRHPLG